jgi:UDP-N-acetylmuramyl pentapeptide phosphotransferase/UDP-N-acetylglucosamine-1-phosphate transferase
MDDPVRGTAMLNNVLDMLDGVDLCASIIVILAMLALAALSFVCGLDRTKNKRKFF